MWIMLGSNERHCCIPGRSEVTNFHFLRLDWENDKELDTKVDAANNDGDSLCHCFCPDSLVDHIAATVLAPEMDDGLLSATTYLDEVLGSTPQT